MARPWNFAVVGNYSWHPIASIRSAPSLPGRPTPLAVTQCCGNCFRRRPKCAEVGGVGATPPSNSCSCRSTHAHPSQVASCQSATARMRCCGTSRCETDRCADSRAPRPDQCRGRKSPLLKVWSGVLVVRCAVIWITGRGTHRVSAGAIARVPAADALALANAGHQLTAAHGGPGRANSVACGRGAGARATARRKAGGWCCQRQHRCKRDRRTQSSQICHCCSISLV